jgi:hypothetical protein
MKKQIALISLGVLLLANPALAKAPADSQSQPSSTVNSRAVREEPLPPPPVTAKAGQWWELARRVGWTEANLPTLDYIIYRESKGDPNVWNKQDPMGGSRCLVQINGFWTKFLRQQGVLNKANDLFDPATCLTAALAIYQYEVDNYGWGFGPWGITPNH